MKKDKKNVNPGFYKFEIYPHSEQSKINIKGNSNKSIVVILKNASKEDINFLEKVFKAVGKNLETDVFVINDSNLILYKNLIDFVTFEKLLVFGAQPKEIGLHLNIIPYQLVPFQKRTLLFCHSLEVISEDSNKKKQLWEKLQIMFK